MAKKPAKKTAARRRPASAAKPARSGDRTHVSFGVHGLHRIVDAVHKAGLAKQFHDHIGNADAFVKVPRASLAKIKSFAQAQPQLAGLASEMSHCDCPPNDPFCIYFLK